jgi:hypothetical protein
MAGKQHFPIVTSRQKSIQVRPVATVRGPRRRCGALHFNRRLSAYGHLSVSRGDIEVVHGVPQKIAILHDVRSRIDSKCEIEAALVPIAARLQPYLHDALAHCGLVAKSRDVSDGENH